MEPQSAFSLIEWHEILDSTNNEAKREFPRLDNLSIVAAVEQTAGRGRGTHTWVSKPGENLTFSIILKLPAAFLAAGEAVRIMHLCSVSLCKFLEKEGVEPRIKWPNDIWVEDSKIAGILIENIFSEGYLVSSVIGVGLNLNQKEFDPLLPNPSSLGLITSKYYELSATLDDFYKIFCRLYSELGSESGRARLELEFSKRMFVLEKPVQDRLGKAIEDFEAAK